jgi:hypothetical protein
MFLILSAPLGCAEIPKSWSINFGRGGGFNPTYDSQSINSLGEFNFSKESFVLSSGKMPERVSVKLSGPDLEKLKNLFAKAYPFSVEGKTPAAPYYVWYDIAAEKGKDRYFAKFDQPEVRELIEFLDGLKEKYSSKNQ